MTYSNSNIVKAESLKEVIYELPLLDGGGSVLNKIRELEESLVEVQKELAEAPINYAPPIGTYLYSKNNPGETWIGTVWTQVNEGTYLTSAGSTYTTGQSYGKNSVTLTTSNLPSHTHTGPSHTHTMAHTHTGPSHTHGVGTLATASAGTHNHDWVGHAKCSLNTGSTYKAALFGKDSSWSYISQGSGPQSSGAHTHTLSGATAAAGTGTTGANSAANTGAAGTGNTGATGSGSAFNNMPQSLAIPLWTRTK